MSGEEIKDQAEKAFNSKAYKEADLKYLKEVKQNYWIAACLNGDWIGLSRDMVIQKHKGKHSDYYTHHCPKCNAPVYDPKQALNDPIYEFNT